MKGFSWAVPLVSLVVILVFGLTTVWSTVPSLLMSQVIFLLIGVVALMALGLMDSRSLQSLGRVAYWLSLALLLLTYLVGSVSRGSLRWIDLGPFRFQTSEFAKPLLILAWATWFGEEGARTVKKFAQQLLAVGIPVMLVLFQPDLGSALVIGGVGVAIMVHSGARVRYFGGLIGAALLISPLLFSVLHDYQRERISSFINPYADPAASGYNVIQAMVAVGSGQLWGKGVRQGTQSHLRFLPERHTDFVFASFAEEFGFLGVGLLLLAFYGLLASLLALSRRGDRFASLLTAGVFWLIFIQMTINVGMNLGVLPVTGITLPFVSYGGSSMISSLIALGLVFASNFR